MLQCPEVSAVVVPIALPLLASATVLLARAVPAMFIEEALSSAGAVVVITGGVNTFAGGGGGGGGIKIDSSIDEAVFWLDPEVEVVALVVFKLLEFGELCGDEFKFSIAGLLSEGPKLIRCKLLPGRSKIGVGEPFGPETVGPCIA